MTLLITGTLVPINEENSDGMMISMLCIRIKVYSP